MGKTAVVTRIHFLPRLHHVQRIVASDVCVVMDDHPFQSSPWQRRTVIKTPQGVKFLTLPLDQSTTSGLVTDARLDGRQDWKSRVSGTLRSCYARTPHCEPIMRELSGLLAGCDHLYGLNRTLLLWALRGLSIETPVVAMSALGQFTEHKGDLMAALTKAAGCDTYLCGQIGVDVGFYEPTRFQEVYGVAVKAQKWYCSPYPQLWGGFEPCLSVLDALFNIGWEGTSMLLRQCYE